ncbi:MAG: hypothetical protein M3O41_14285 [Pseudomonadota bacterium]|nr:hypothetical protein [Pseudomonadota bacterium]
MQTQAKSTVPSKRDRLGTIADLLDRSGIDIDDVDRIQNVKLWQGFFKDEDGEAHVVDMSGVTLAPTWDDGPEWPVVQPAKPVRPRSSPAKPKAVGEPLTACIFPDPQIGFRALNGTLDPFHCETSMALALAITKSLRPDKVVNLGDFLDFAEFSRFEQDPEFANTTQASIDRAHEYLGQQREVSRDDTEIELIEGNHDRRLAKHVIANARAALRLRQANTPESWPVLSVPNLLRLDELGVKYVEGYPAGITWLNDRLACVHGERLKVAQVVDEERVSVIQGHIHRIARQHKTWRTPKGPRTTLAASPGCLCRIDGAVPSTKSSTQSDGTPIMRPEDWQNGMCVVTYMPGDGEFQLELVPFHNGSTYFRGKRFSV